MKATRLLPALAAAAALVLAPGLGLADPGDGKGNGITNNPQVPPGQSTQDTSVPQPPSNADFTGNGANEHGPYDSTRDGSPSMNGNGEGEAVGKPCAGCVGKADNKNPQGQLPGGSDANKGYECDANHGVGRSNPAHTGCKPTETTPETPPPSTKTEVPPPPPGGGAPQAPAPQVVTAAEAEDLAFTGFDVLPLGLGGLALVGAGGAAVLIARRTKRS
ncbi:hypothetical protein [Lentzea kentuckyensis]|uniref:hypothetical protein n=1 Tax=Lentzea kentuckyensis TaxID=360086 RepID=UPI000A39E0D6|nr:hypothetical protein [Lentzea kentuckyensis]